MVFQHFASHHWLSHALRRLALSRGLPDCATRLIVASCLCWGCVQLAMAEVPFERVQLSDEFYSEGATYGDFDADGQGDVAVGPWIYYGPSFTAKSRFYTGEPYPPEQYSQNFLMYTSDINADKRPDLVVLGFPGKESWWYENPGTSAREQLWAQHTILDSVDNESPLIADIDGDGTDDLICSSRGHYGYASHAGQDPRQPWKFTHISPNNAYHRFTHGLGIGDVNNDGHLDLMEKDGWWQNPGPVSDKTEAAPALWAFHPFAFSSGGAQMAAIDLDGDGRNEVLTGLVAHGYGLVYYRALDPDATQFERIEIMTDDPANSPVGMAVSQLHALDVGDINGDGLPDIVTGKRWWAHANKDAGNSQPALLVWLELQRRGPRVQFVPHVVDISSGVGTQVMLGDVNRDGLLDIVSGNKRGAYLFLQRTQTLPAEQRLVAALATADPFGQQAATDFALISSSDGANNAGFVPSLAGRSLNFNFDQPSLIDWEVRGPMAANILASSSAANSQQRFVDSGADKPGLIGEMISRPFKLKYGQLVCQLGGIADPETRVELVDNGTGQVLAELRPSDRSLQTHSMDVSQYSGRTARLRIIDHSAEAYLQVDDFRLQP